VETPTSTVVVSSLAFTTTQDGLLNHFKSAGQIVKSKILLRRARGKFVSSGRGIVEFATAAAATNAIESLNESELDGRAITVRYSRRRVDSDEEGDEEEDASNDANNNNNNQGRRGNRKVRAESSEKIVSATKVFVQNLSWSTTDEDLEQYFSRAGDVASAKVRMTRRGRSLGQGIVEFVDTASISEALRLNNTELDGRNIAVRSFYEDDEDTKAADA
jgi:RNA recognition motif-containing protein